MARPAVSPEAIGAADRAVQAPGGRGPVPGPVQRSIGAKADTPVDGNGGRADGGGQMAWSRIVADQEGGPLQQPGQTPKAEPTGQVGRVTIEPVEQPVDQSTLRRRADHGQPSSLAGQLAADHGQPLYRPAPPRIVRSRVQDDQRSFILGQGGRCLGSVGCGHLQPRLQDHRCGSDKAGHLQEAVDLVLVARIGNGAVQRRSVRRL